MAGKVKSVSVVFQAFTDKFEKKVDTAGDKILQFEKKVATGVASFLAARASVAAFNNQLDHLTQLKNISDSLQVSPDFLNGISLATEQLGESFEKAQDVIKEFNIRMGEARTGAGPAVNGIELLGMSIADFNDMSPEEGFLKVAEAISKIEDPQLKIFTAGEIFGGAGEDMLALLNQGEEGLQRFIDKARELSGPISSEDLQNVKDANDALGEMQRSFEGIIQQILIQMTPAIRDITEFFNKLLGKVKEIGKVWTEISEGLEAFFLIAGASFGLLKKDELDDALALVGQKTEEMKKQLAKNTFKSEVEVKAKMADIKTFVESLSAGSSEAFRALNPSQKVDMQKEMVKEQKEANATLKSIDSKLNNNNIVVRDIG